MILLKNIIDFDEITLDDCLRFYDNNKTFEINDGRIVNIVTGDKNESRID